MIQSKAANNRILVIDDMPAIHEDFRKVLGGSGTQTAQLDDVMAKVFGEKVSTGGSSVFEIDSALQGRDGLKKVEASITSGTPYAMAFVDVRMPPGWDGIETIAHLWETDPALQIVLCTAYSDYPWQEMVTRLGISDRLVVLKKPFDTIEVLQLAHAFTNKWQVTRAAETKLEDLERMVAERTEALHTANEQLRAEIVERTQTQEELRRAEERFSNAFNASPLPMAILRRNDFRYEDVNPSFLVATGFAREDLLNRHLQSAGIVFDTTTFATLKRQLAAGEKISGRKCHLFTESGITREGVIWLEHFHFAGDTHLLAIVQDVSERTALEEQLRQAQKMEAVGHLAAGIAHDFNNLLTVIQGHSMLRMDTPDIAAPVRDSLRSISQAAQRAADLTRQLLAFSRQQVMQSKVISLAEVVTNVSAMLRRLIGEQITLEFSSTENLPPIYADLCNMEQVILNLAVNARDAMANSGKLSMMTELVEFGLDYSPKHPKARPGSFVRLTVTDTGAGMDEATLQRIFEPFFTTKEIGKGTGMGLATVYGIIEQHQGWIEVTSVVNQGTSFRIYLPVTTRLAGPDSEPEAPIAPVSKGKTVLIVEDDPELRSLAREVLTENGFQVLDAGDGPAALAIEAGFVGKIDLLLTDMVMPAGLSGPDVAERFIAERPGTPVIYSSGYSLDLFGDDLQLREGVNYLPKPYPPGGLIRAVSRALAEPAQLALAS